MGKAMWEYASKLELMERLICEGRLSEKDMEELNKKVKTEVSGKYR